MTTSIQFKFNHPQLSVDDKIKVVNFVGDEGISRLYEFSIELISTNADLDIDAILDSQASLKITLGTDSRNIQGIVSHFEAVKQVNNQTIYKAKLVPRLWELSLYHTNEVYLEQTVPEIIEIVLKEAGFTSLDYDISGLEGTYRKWPYKCQYGESHLDFISRLMERDGIYYYFTEGDSGEKLIFCDTLNAQEPIAIPDVVYSPSASLEINTLENNVHSFVSQQKRVPHKVLVKDYNDDKPSVDIKGEAIIDPDANPNSEVYVWGQNIETPEEGKLLADIRAEEILVTKKTYHGESSVIRLLTGYNFALNKHFRQTCNQEYLLLNLNHEGSDPSVLDSSDTNSSASTIYNNQFSAIESGIQFRPEQLTAKPEIHGTLNAFVDAEGDGQYAELDEEGRYRITLPFDRVDRDGGKASHWLRMSQPFSGENQGMSFPLRKGAEVLLTFIGGDPDRPIIAGSIPNASQPSVTTSDNQTNSVIQTGSGNKIELEDQEGKNRIKLQTGDNKTYMHLGAPNHDGDGWVIITNGMERKEVTGGQQITVKSNLPGTDESVSYTNTGTTTGAVPDVFCEHTQYAFTPRSLKGKILDDGDDSLYAYDEVGNKRQIDLVDSDIYQIDGVKRLSKEFELKGRMLFERRLGDRYVWEQGNEYRFNSPGDKIFSFGSERAIVICQSDAELDSDYDRDDATLFRENQNINGELDSAERLVDAIVGLGTTLKGYQSFTADDNGDYFKASGLLDTEQWADLLDNKSQMRVAKHNTFNIQEGNIFDFGGYWNYNLGNSYTETHGAQDTTINELKSHDKMDVAGPNWTEAKGDLVTIKHTGKEQVDKSYSDTYSYTKGNGLEVTVGDSEGFTYGDSRSYTEGNTHDVVVGDSYSKQTGDCENHYYGATKEFNISATSSMSLSAASDMFLGVKSDMFLGIVSDICISLKSELNIGYNLENDLAGKFETCSNSLAARAVDVDATISNITTSLNVLAAGLTEVHQSASFIEVNAIAVSGGGLKMIA